jgi:hypothetical protein
MCEAYVKTCYDFGNDPMKMCFEHKIRLKVDCIIKDIIILFLSCKLSYFMKHFCCDFLKFWACIYIFLLHCSLHSFKVLHNKWCPSHYVCIMWKQMNEIISELKKLKMHYFLCIFYLKTYFDMCFDNLIKFYVSHQGTNFLRCSKILSHVIFFCFFTI